MSRIWITIFIVLLHATLGALALERIKKKPPTSAEAERIASDMAMADSSLQKGDIVSTDRGFFVYRGIGADGYTNEFTLVANPLAKLAGPETSTWG